MSEDAPEDFREMRRRLMEERKGAILRAMGANLNDPMGNPIIVASLTNGKQDSAFRKLTGVGDSIDDLIVSGERREGCQTIALGAMCGIPIRATPLPSFLSRAEAMRRRAAMRALKRFGMARKVSEKDGLDVDRGGEGL